MARRNAFASMAEKTRLKVSCDGMVLGSSRKVLSQSSLACPNTSMSVKPSPPVSNEVRYVPASEAAALQKAIEGYQLFIKLAEQYADEVIRLTRRERDRRKRPGKPKP